MRKFLLSVSFLLPLLFSSLCYAQSQELKMIQIPREQFLTLESNNRALIMKLETLNLALETLDRPLQEQINELANCKETLITLENDLLKANEKLLISQNSLENVKALQKQTEKSLTTLERKISKYKKQRVYGWIFGAGISLGMLLKVVAR